jgi:hypothetical protein
MSDINSRISHLREISKNFIEQVDQQGLCSLNDDQQSVLRLMGVNAGNGLSSNQSFKWKEKSSTWSTKKIVTDR